jgi:hypothetical protein
MTKPNLNAAIDELRQNASDIAKLHGESPVELLVYAAAYELIRQMEPEAAMGVFAEAVGNLLWTQACRGRKT